MREVAIERNKEAVDFAYRVMTGEIGIVIFLTGVGFRQLLAAIDPHLDKQRFLNSLSDIVTIARGPKPVVAMREVGLQPSYRAPEPNTWREVLQIVDQHVPVANQVIGLQEYGITNHSLVAGLEARGASVAHVRVYQWDFPENVVPLQENITALCQRQRDCLLFTSAHQAVNLIRMAENMGKQTELRLALRETVIASIGPTTTEMLQQLEIPVDIEPEHSKMGHLVQAAAEKSNRVLKAKRFVGSFHAQPSSNPQSTTDSAGDLMTTSSTFIKACYRQPTDVTPVWLMRQAGRYMAEYRAVREKHTFLELCKNPALCADGPVIHNPIRSPKDIDRVHALTDMAPLQFVADTVRLTRAALPLSIPVIGFAGSPFTLASYMIEGGGSRNYVHTKTLMYGDPEAWRVLMSKLVESISLYLNSQIASGAQCVQLFDSWAGCLSPMDYRSHVLPFMVQLLESISPSVPVINFATGNPMLTSLLRGDSRTVVGLDWRVPLDVGWDMAGSDRAVQGNMDPTVLFAGVDAIREAVKNVLSLADNRPGHIFNLGHGILPGTPVDNVIALVDMVHEMTDRRKA